MDVTRRIASEGYVALAPDLYKGQVATEPDEARKLVMELDMPAAVEEIGDAIDHLLAQEFVSGDKAAIVGFCMGGRLALMTALANDNLAVAAPFYGSPLTPEEAANVKAPVLGLYGADDGGIPVDAVQSMGEALTAAGIDNEIQIYAGAPHAFFNDTRESYRPEAAADAWPTDALAVGTMGAHRRRAAAQRQRDLIMQLRLAHRLGQMRGKQGGRRLILQRAAAQ
jgi:carboxymethylenebutenolidase